MTAMRTANHAPRRPTPRSPHARRAHAACARALVACVARSSGGDAALPAAAAPATRSRSPRARWPKRRPSPTTASTGSGPRFLGQPLAAADGQKGYISRLGDSVYYGDCVKGKGIFGGGSCLLPLQVTTVIYRLHSNATLGPQRNIVVRGVPATVYDEGRSIELYSGRVAIDVFSNTFAHAYAAALALRPLNAPGSAADDLPPPVYCPGLYGAQSACGSHERTLPADPASGRAPASRRASAAPAARRRGARRLGRRAAAWCSPARLRLAGDARARAACRSRGAG